MEHLLSYGNHSKGRQHQLSHSGDKQQRIPFHPRFQPCHEYVHVADSWLLLPPSWVCVVGRIHTHTGRQLDGSLCTRACVCVGYVHGSNVECAHCHAQQRVTSSAWSHVQPLSLHVSHNCLWHDCNDCTIAATPAEGQGQDVTAPSATTGPALDHDEGTGLTAISAPPKHIHCTLKTYTSMQTRS